MSITKMLLYFFQIIPDPENKLKYFTKTNPWTKTRFHHISSSSSSSFHHQFIFHSSILTKLEIRVKTSMFVIDLWVFHATHITWVFLVFKKALLGTLFKLKKLHGNVNLWYTCIAILSFSVSKTFYVLLNLYFIPFVQYCIH